MTICLVRYNRKYLPAIVTLFNSTIQRVNRKDYSQAELNEWIQSNPDFDLWHGTLTSSYCLLAIKEETLVGFGNITSEGDLDLFYVSHAMIHQGVGRLIYNELEKYAVLEKAESIYTDASITAVPFFTKMGLEVIRKQDNQRNGENLVNYRMVKKLVMR
ncbi:GNAT family N-acetyltransferase [Listeria welshimeri]|uniref:GNAT family N-acetyltransferase n=1 Tax=Enterococcus sp. DIV0086 TaxID=2774655 RepID=UPI001624EFCB|nr:GNAT family N-acetyltransferase [Listeria welshimeri]